MVLLGRELVVWWEKLKGIFAVIYLEAADSEHFVWDDLFGLELVDHVRAHVPMKACLLQDHLALEIC
jgi:hypothetical protein